MFQDKYKSAYDKISPQGEVSEMQVAQWIESIDRKNDLQKKTDSGKDTGKITRSRKTKMWKSLGPIAATFLVVCLICILGVPVAAENIPAFYGVLERNTPGLVDYLIPVQQTDSSQGIIMNLEAARIEGNMAEILVSFTDEGENDYIHGLVDMYDSYHLHSYSGVSNIGGCSFVEYDEEQDKAYYQIDLISSDGTFATNRMEFSVHQLLTDCDSYTQQISLEDIMRSCEVKAVTLNGRGGAYEEHVALERLTIPGNEIDSRPGHLVMDIPLDGFEPNTMEITGVAYMDGILRVQLFRGDFKEADRHMKIYMLDEAGNEIYPNMSVMWHEEIAGEEVLVDEFYFVITEEQLETYTLMGEGDIRAGSIQGNWNIVFDVQ